MPFFVEKSRFAKTKQRGNPGEHWENKGTNNWYTNKQTHRDRLGKTLDRNEIKYRTNEYQQVNNCKNIENIGKKHGPCYVWTPSVLCLAWLICLLSLCAGYGPFGPC